MGLLNRFLKVLPNPDARRATTLESIQQSAERMLEKGMALEQQGQADLALQLYDQVVGIAPELARAHFNRGNILMDRGEVQNALEAYAKAVMYKPDSASAHYNMGNLHSHLGNTRAAIEAFQNAISLKPDFADAHRELGRVFQDAGHLDLAIASYGLAVGIDPKMSEVHNNLGNALMDSGDIDNAMVSYGRAIELNPDSPAIHHNHGIALMRRGLLDEAEKSYRRALSGDARLPPSARAQILNNLGLTLRDLNRTKEALSTFELALQNSPDSADVHMNLGTTLALLGHQTAAILHYRKALIQQPERADTLMNLGCALRELGQIDEGISAIRQAIRIQPDLLVAQSNLLFTQLYLSSQIPGQGSFEARSFGECASTLASPFTVWPNSCATERTLRVGLVSGDFRDHPVGNFLEGALSALSSQLHEKVIFFAYSNHLCADQVTKDIQKSCHIWRSVVGLSDREMAQRVHDDQIDILIDLSGHTAHNRLAVFAWKPAPVQITWLGYLASTGVSAVDYVLADSWTLPSELENQFTERVWRMPESYICFTQPAQITRLGPLPALSNGFITFGSFNNLSKINDTVIEQWSKILSALPNSRLFLKTVQLHDPATRKMVQDKFYAYGIEAERLILKALVPRAEYLAQYHEIDIALDPFPYTGITTTVESLWMGVPVLTLSGNSFLSRQGVGIMTNVGLTDWIASDLEDYVRRATFLANDIPGLAELRCNLRQRVIESAIFNTARFAYHFETALRGMWAEWCSASQRNSLNNKNQLTPISIANISKH